MLTCAYVCVFVRFNEFRDILSLSRAALWAFEIQKYHYSCDKTKGRKWGLWIPETHSQNQVLLVWSAVITFLWCVFSQTLQYLFQYICFFVFFVLAPKRCESIWSHVDAHRGSSFVCCFIVEQETPWTIFFEFSSILELVWFCFFVELYFFL